MNETLKDHRPILKLVYPGGDFWAVGNFGITAIEPYTEPGEMADVLWFRIRKGKSLHARVQGKYVMEVIYTIPPPASREFKISKEKKDD